MVVRDLHGPGEAARPAGPIVLADESEDLMRCAYRHLAVAATQLARGDACWPEESARYALAAARFRALTEQAWTAGASRWREAAPFVTAVSGAPVPVADLFASAVLRRRTDPPARSIDPELVNDAKDLLRGLSWQVPPLDDDTA
jgi:hypothetical protein